MNCNDITILCKVVDNYGDIGFVYRLARALTELNAGLQLRLVVSDLAAFKSMAPNIDATAAVQRYRYEKGDCMTAMEAQAAVAGTGECPASADWLIYDWNAAEVCTRAFRKRPPHIILECFQCGRPAWLEALLFADNAKDADAAGAATAPVPSAESALPTNAIPIANAAHRVQILNLDYLTAEEYADDFHCLKSGTRSQFVKKVNFMPGFTAKTGGLVLDSVFMRSLDARSLPPQVEALVAAALASSSGTDVHRFLVPIFSYERDFAAIVAALTRFQAERRKTDAAFTVCALVAAGKSCTPFLQAWERADKPFAAVQLPFLPQEAWDSVLCAADFSFVRGEDSLSRACLAGVPFVWHAYPQEDNYQLVKVQALFSRLQPYLPQTLAAPLEQVWRSYNTTGALGEEALFTLLAQHKVLCIAFSAFSHALIANGNLAERLLAYLATL